MSDYFTDVPEGNVHTDSIDWLYEKDITKGLSTGIYGPDASVSRDQMASFLRRTVRLIDPALAERDPVVPPVEPPVEPPTEPPVEPPVQGDIHYESGPHGNIVITDSDVRVTAEPDATFGSVTFRDVDSVTVDGLTCTDTISVERTNWATNITVRKCKATGVHIRAGRHVPPPDGWLVEQNDLSGAWACISVSSGGDGYPYISDTRLQFNSLSSPGQDAIRASLYNGLVIVGNEIFNVIEDGSHNDGIQGVWGGNNLTFAHNYFHDNNCQPFFLKDGYYEGVELFENLSVRNRVASAPVGSKVYTVRDFTMRDNTFWDGGTFYLRDGNLSHGELDNLLVRNNVIQNFGVLDPPSYVGVLDEHDNVFGGGWTWMDHMGPGSIEDPNPAFVNWQIPGAGITWNPDDRRYGLQLESSPDSGWWTRLGV